MTLLNHFPSVHNTQIKSVKSFLADFESALESTLSGIDQPVLTSAKRLPYVEEKIPNSLFLSDILMAIMMIS